MLRTMYLALPVTFVKEDFTQCVRSFQLLT